MYIYKHFFMLNKNPDTRKKNNESFGFLQIGYKPDKIVKL